MSDIDHFYDIFFELSNKGRYNILQALVKRSYNVTSMAKHLTLTTQESSRHLNRLGEVRLIKKNVSGEYELTNYGRLILSQVSGILFASSYRDYFIDHKTDSLSCLFHP